MWKSNERRETVPADANDLLPLTELDVPEGVTSLGPTIVVKGELTAAEHLIIEGRFEGQLAIPDHGLAVGRRGTVSAEVLAQTITVLGQARGSLIASHKVEIRAGGAVEGRLVAAKVVIEEGAYFKGTVDPKRTTAALAVGRHRLKERSPETPTAPSLLARSHEQR